MQEETKTVETQPRIPAGVMRVLSEILAARVDSTASMVEPSHFVSGYYSEDLSNKHRLVVELEKAFDIAIDTSAFESAKTVEDLAVLIVRQTEAKKATKSGRSYIIVYKTDDGQIVETHVHARNHNEAVDSLRAEGLDQVLSVQRADDEDDDHHGRRVRNGWNGCVIPFVLALLGAAAVVGYFWMRRH